MKFVMGKKLNGNVIDVVKEREGYSVYVRYSDGGKVYISPARGIFTRPPFIVSQEVVLDVSEGGVAII